MASLDHINRARWSRDQKAQASQRFADQLEQDRIDRLAALQAQVDAFSTIADPLAARIVADAKAEIARLWR